jgi:hypothetical protein
MVFDLAGLLRALVEGEVRFVVIGGIAVAAHAAVRATEDLDVVPDPDLENLDRLCNVLSGLDATLLLNPQRTLDAEVRAALQGGRNVTVSTRLGDVDVVQRLPGVPQFAALREDAVDVEIFGVPFHVCSRRHLIEMKRARGSSLDLADLERLADPSDGGGG